MSQPEPSLRTKVATRIVKIVQGEGYRRSAGIEEAAKRATHWPRDVQQLLLLEGCARLYGERERKRRAGLRQGYAVHRKNGTLSLALLDQTFAEANVTVAREESHAAGAADQAAWDRFLLARAEQRCRERGLDPLNTAMVLRDFLDEDEVKALRDDWLEGQAA